MKNSAFEDFSEPAQETLDFARCQRPDGSFYGTSGQCRKGVSVGAKEKAALKKAAKAGNERAQKALNKLEGKKSGGSGVIGSVELNSGDDIYQRLMYNDDKVSRGAVKLVKQQRKGSISADMAAEGILELLEEAGHKTSVDKDDIVWDVVDPMEDRV